MSGRRSGRGAGRSRGRGQGRCRQKSRSEERSSRSQTPQNRSPHESQSSTPRRRFSPRRSSPRRGSPSPGRPPLEVIELPRQQDLRREQPATSTHSNLRLVERSRDPSSTADFQHLIAAINKLEERDRVQSPGRRVSVDQEDTLQPGYSPTRDPLRLREVLDAMATFCVSQPKGEVVAVSMEAGKDMIACENCVNLFITTNTEVVPATKRQLSTMWRLMQSIALTYPKTHETEKTPPKQNGNHETRTLLDDLAQLCLSFTFQKWKKRVNGKLSLLLSIPCSDLSSSHPFLVAREHVRRLAEVYTAANPEVGMPGPGDKSRWYEFTVHLRDAQQAIDGFLAIDPLENQRYAQFHSITSYLRKIILPINLLDILGSATRSPQCRKVLLCQYHIKPLPDISSKAQIVPSTPTDWEKVLQKAAGIRNNEYFLDLGVLEKDCNYMSREAISRNTSVHCEVKLALHALRAKQNRRHQTSQNSSCDGPRQ